MTNGPWNNCGGGSFFTSSAINGGNGNMPPLTACIPGTFDGVIKNYQRNKEKKCNISVIEDKR